MGMKTGDRIPVTLAGGGEIVLILDDRVLPDRTCGQYDSGFFAFIEGHDEEFDYFVSDEGFVYGESADGSVSVEVARIEVPA